MAINVQVTNAGRAALVNAANNGTNAVLISTCGLSQINNVYDANANNLIGQFKTIDNISGGAVDDDTISLAFADQTTDAYDVRAVAFYLSDGTLFAIHSQSAPITTKVAEADMILGANIKFLDVASNQIIFGNTNLFNPPATETKYGVVKRATTAEVLAGVDAVKYVTPKSLKDNGFWNAANDGSGSGLDSDQLDGQHGSHYLDCGNFTGTLSDARLPATMSAKTFTGNPNVNGNQVWNSGNDGSGSGLDSDQLDGQHGSFYLDCGNFTGIMPSPRLSGYYNINSENAYKLGNITASNYWHSGNDGSGSGLDADLLDGQNSDYFTNIPARLGFTPIQQSGGTGQLGNKIYIGWSGSRLKAQVDVTDHGNFVFDYNISDVWRASNDGSGSGLDADMLDGQHASSFMPKSGGTFTGPTYYPSFEGVTGLENGTGDGAGWSLYNTKLHLHWGLGFATYDGTINAYFDSRAGSFNVKGGYYVNNNTVWHAGNDGSGSGLDADLLDGNHANAFAMLAAFAASGAASGYQKIPNASDPTKPLIIQWGSYNAPANDTRTIALPIPFPNAALFGLHHHAMTGNGYAPRASFPNLSHINCGQDAFQASSNPNGTHYWLAIGN